MNEKNTRSLGEPFKQIKIPGTEINVCYVFFHLIKFYWIYKTIQLQVNGNKGIQKEKKTLHMCYLLTWAAFCDEFMEYDYKFTVDITFETIGLMTLLWRLKNGSLTGGEKYKIWITHLRRI